jgi:hypothetical protein
MTSHENGTYIHVQSIQNHIGCSFPIAVVVVAAPKACNFGNAVRIGIRLSAARRGTTRRGSARDLFVYLFVYFPGDLQLIFARKSVVSPHRSLEITVNIYLTTKFI